MGTLGTIGAGAGTVFGGPVGGAIGGAIGGLAENFFGGQSEEDAARAIEQARLAQAQQTIDAQQGFGAQQRAQYQPIQALGMGAMRDMAGMTQDVPEMGRFGYQGQVSDYLDPNVEYQQNQMRRQLEQGAAARGGLGSSGTMRDVQEGAGAIARQAWGDAQNRMMQDKNFAYQAFKDRFNAARQGSQERFGRTSQLAGLGAQASGNIGQSFGQQSQQYGQAMAPVMPAAGTGAAAGARAQGSFLGELAGQAAPQIFGAIGESL